MQSVDYMIEVMRAYKNGKTVQARYIKGDRWEDCSRPVWNWSSFNYRIKPNSAECWAAISDCNKVLYANSSKSEVIDWIYNLRVESVGIVARLVRMREVE